jgi:hypothetical protein
MLLNAKFQMQRWDLLNLGEVFLVELEQLLYLRGDKEVEKK